MITYNSVEELTQALRRAEAAHGQYEKQLGHSHPDWPSWYANFMAQENQEPKTSGPAA